MAKIVPNQPDPNPRPVANRYEEMMAEGRASVIRARLKLRAKLAQKPADKPAT